MTFPARVFVGITGASGAPYALRLLTVLGAAGCRVELCVSDSGVTVLRHELGLSAHDRHDVIEALLARAGATATVHDPFDLAAPPASGSNAPDVVILCPCSMSSVAHVALGSTRTLIHRVADVALKERRTLIIVPRETPVTAIHLRRMLELAEAGAIIVPASPAFYFLPETLAEAVDHVVGKVLAVAGVEHHLFPPWEGEQS